MGVWWAAAIPAAEARLELVGRLRLGFQAADIWVHDSTAYLGSHGCGRGVQAVDIADPDPRTPREIASYPTPNHWGVFVKDGLIYLSDIDAGLYILRQM